jgi:hypothetical protein
MYRGPDLPVRYAVEFREGAGASTAGPLLIEEETILLQGRRAGARVELRIPPAELAQVRIGRGHGERLHGYSTVVLERHSGPPVLVAPFGIALLHEIADLLASLSGSRHGQGEETLQLLVPLRPAVKRVYGSCSPKDRRSTRPRSGCIDTTST